MKNVRIGDLLVESGMITQEQLMSALQVQKNAGGKRLGEILIDLGVITEQQLADALQRRLGVPKAELRNVNIPNEVLKEVTPEYARTHSLIPVRIAGNTLYVAMSDPLDYTAINELSIKNAKTIEPMIATKGEIARAIDRTYSTHQVAAEAEDVTRARSTHNLDALIEEDLNQMEGRVDSAPIVRFVNAIVDQAYQKRASDIHFEPYEENVRIRLRIDGELLQLTEISHAVHHSVVTRIKILAGMDIASRRVPQDGRFDVDQPGGTLALRVSTMPTMFGETVVLRLLTDTSKGVQKIEQLGMTQENCDLFYKLLKIPYGIILVTGPTGSGKTTTLYSMMAELAVPQVNMVTIEDPIEKVIAGVNQTQINPKAGLTFAAGLRALLRQDPDIIMLGEIRDTETADIATRAAITGHLVLSCLHTNTAAASYLRLADMGIEPYIIASSVVGVIGQRLVRRICPKCKQEIKPDDAQKRYLASLGAEDIDTIYAGAGCDECNYTGHLGRTAVHEVIVTDQEIRSMVVRGTKTTDIEEHLRKSGQKFMMNNALDLLRKGEIGIRELNALALE